jgi:Flp pilus assembly protein TadG
MMGRILPAVPDGHGHGAGGRQEAVARPGCGTVGRNVVGLSRKRARGERGAAAVEFALVVPLLLLLVFGMIDFGWAINRYTVLNNATREGVRLASLGADSSEISASVTDSLTDAGLDAAAVVVDLRCTTPTGGACGSWADQASGGTAIITVSYTTDWLTPAGAIVGEELNISKTSRMRIE